MKNMRTWMVSLALVTASTLVASGQTQPSQVAAGTAGTQNQQALRQFSGAPIDVDYSNANLRNVLKQLAQVGGINIVIDPSVSPTATVDLTLTQVPWDQVMDVVLRSSQLTYQVEGPVIRVLTRKALTDELNAEAEQKKASEAAPDLVSFQRRLNYATAEEVKKLLESSQLVSSRGTVDFDTRSNMLIVKDVQKNVDEIQKLVNELDKPEPQVEIEARIVQANRDTAREIGVQWGFNGRVMPDLGNTTGAGFPNRGTLGGRTQAQGPITQGPTDPRASDLERTGTAVNLPVPGATSGVGLSLGAINGAFNLDVALTALEHKGEVKVISTPRVVTQNNKQAEVRQGFQVPIQVVANNTVTVQFKDALLSLKVTPQITAADTVIMRVVLENAQPDFSRAVDGNPSINTQSADTQVQVANGETTVIGGIVQSRDTKAHDQTPGLGSIPLLGWLFKRTSDKSENQELLIFITPRIIR
jgi:type IV pilus assembly protein PilQ